MNERSPEVARAARLAAAGQRAAAERSLAAAAGAGDADAAFQLALWHLSGQPIGRDLARARDGFARASALGHPDAPAIHAAFLAGGIGGPVDWPGAMRLLAASDAAEIAAQRALLATMDLLEDGRPATVPEVRPLAYAPRIATVSGLLTTAECAYLVDAARPLLEPSVVIDPRSGRFVRDPIRTSDAAAFPIALENPAIHAINLRLAAITGTSVGQGEPLQVLRYAPGQQYRLHSDAIAGLANQRILTALIWLNDDYEGGATRFPDLGLDLRGRTGDALIFANVDAAGRPEAKARHAGLPINRGTKFLASRWIRAQPLL